LHKKAGSYTKKAALVLTTQFDVTSFNAAFSFFCVTWWYMRKFINTKWLLFAEFEILLKNKDNEQFFKMLAAKD